MTIALLSTIIVPMMLSLMTMYTMKLNARASHTLGSLSCIACPLAIIVYILTSLYTGVPIVTYEWVSISGLDLNFSLQASSIGGVLLLTSAVLLLFNTALVSNRNIGEDEKNGKYCFFLIVYGLINGALMSASFYTFFVFMEAIFIVYYLYHSRLAGTKVDVGVGKILNISLPIMVVMALVYFEFKSGSVPLEGDTSYVDLMVTWILISYFFIKLPIVPRLMWDQHDFREDNIAGCGFFSNVVLILSIYGLHKYVLSLTGSALINSMPYVLGICVFSYLYNFISSIRSDHLLEKQSYIRSSMAALMVGALAGLDSAISSGVVILLISQVFALLSLYILTNGGFFTQYRNNRYVVLLLIVTLYFLMLLPLSGGFVGLSSITVGYMKTSPYFLILIVLGMVLYFINVVQIFITLMHKTSKEDSNIEYKGGCIVTKVATLSCLAIVFIVGVRPSILYLFLGR